MSARKQTIEESRRFRAAMAAHLAAAIVNNWEHDDPSVHEVARRAVRLADAVMAQLEATDPYKDENRGV